jgi:hypothetical protein
MNWLRRFQTWLRAGRRRFIVVGGLFFGIWMMAWWMMAWQVTEPPAYRNPASVLLLVLLWSLGGLVVATFTWSALQARLRRQSGAKEN